MFNYLLFALLILSTFARAQESKLRLRDFTPKYKTDTFSLKGNPAFVIKNVIASHQVKGIKSAFWDEASGLLTVQYDHQLIPHSSVRALFPQGAATENRRNRRTYPVR